MQLSAGTLLAGLLCVVLAAAASAQNAPSAPTAVIGKDNPPAPPKLADLPLKESVSQYGITWTFEKPARVGQFVTGDFYVIGPVKVISADPKPRYGAEVKDEEVLPGETKYTKDPKNRIRNGSMVNPPTDITSAYDSRIRDCDPKLAAKYPLDLRPGDSLVTAISAESLAQNLVLPNPTKGSEESPLKTAAVLTCLAAPAPADAFRPAYCDLKKDKIRRAKDIRWDLLPRVELVKGAAVDSWVNREKVVGAFGEDGVPNLAWVERIFERPWLDHVYSWFSRELHPMENLPGYGRETGRAVSYGALMLCGDLPREKKERLCLRMIQVGIDNWGIATRSKKGAAGGWPAQGGFGNGRKFPIVLAALLLDDEEMKDIRKNAPEASFGEDEHTEMGPSWTGAKVRFAGQYPLSGATDRGPYEHLTPDQWPGPSKTMSEGYRRCCTSNCWVGEALAVRLMKAEKLWDHDAFFVYVDRWMCEDDTQFAAEIHKVYPGFGPGRTRTTTFDPWIDAMWAKHRAAPGMPPADGWK